MTSAITTWLSRAMMGLQILCVCGFLSLARADEPTIAREQQPEGTWLTIAARDGDKFAIYSVTVKDDHRRLVTTDDKPLMDPTWSPDGRKIAFVSFREGNGQIYVHDLESKTTTNITRTKQFERNPVWSPNSERILFTSNRDGNQDIFVMNADGTNPANLTKNPGYDSDPTWSHDGKQIAFASMRDDRPFRLFVMNADGSEQKLLSDIDLNGWVYPSWSPDGKWIVCGKLTDIQTVDLLLFDVEHGTHSMIAEDVGCNSYAAWSPDGRYVAYAHFDLTPPAYSPGQEVDSDLIDGDLMMYDCDKKLSVTLLRRELPTWGPRPTWEPQSKK